MRKDNKYAFNDAYYKRSYRSAVEGSAARDLAVEEEYYEEEEVFEDEYEDTAVEVEREQRQTYRRQAEKSVAASPKVKRVYQINLAATVMLCVSVALLFVFATRYIRYQSNLNLVEKQINNAKIQLNDITAKNAALASKLDAEIDRNFLYTVAVSQLGMQYPNDNQIVDYQTPDQGYVKQYGSIPMSK